MKSAVLSSTLFGAAAAFAPQQSGRLHTRLHKAPVPMDIDHAHYCADHFGECSINEIEDMVHGLHEDRISHVFTDTDGLNNPSGFKMDVELKLLEQDLTLQLGLLQDKHATEEHMHSMGANPNSSTISLPLVDPLLDEESSESLMLCLAIAGIALLPQLLGN